MKSWNCSAVSVPRFDSSELTPNRTNSLSSTKKRWAMERSFPGRIWSSA